MATQDRLLGLTGGVAFKASCVVASTTNLTLSSTQVVDSIVIGADERVLVKDQTDTTKNGIYVASSGSWSRAKDFNGSGDAIPATLVYSDRGTVNGNTLWSFNSSSTADAIDIGTTEITVSSVAGSAGGVLLTTQGDLLTHDGAAEVRLAVGTTSQVVISDGASASWGEITATSISSSAVTAAAIGSSAVTTVKVADSAVTAAKLAMGVGVADGNLPAMDATGYPAADGSQITALTYDNITNATGKVLQVVQTQDGAVATGTVVVPLDDNIPQNDEGDEYMTRSITPKSASSRLKIDVVWIGASGAASGRTMRAALFRDSGADALGVATVSIVNVNLLVTIGFSHDMASPSTGATTFKVRAGVEGAGTTTFNGFSGARKHGGVMASSIIITEYMA